MEIYTDTIIVTLEEKSYAAWEILSLSLYFLLFGIRIDRVVEKEWVFTLEIRKSPTQPTNETLPKMRRRKVKIVLKSIRKTEGVAFYKQAVLYIRERWINYSRKMIGEVKYFIFHIIWRYQDHMTPYSSAGEWVSGKKLTFPLRFFLHDLPRVWSYQPQSKNMN